ncbi:unnamed protein product [Closterium sp. NIES-65]|nr:unnamed protein product [Closterium sp. NIES-65]
MQANQVDCGVYVCIYASELVARGFANLDDGLPALPYGGGLFRRGMPSAVNKPVSPELAEIDAKLRDAVGDIHNISCRVGYCEKDITKLELLVESLTNDLSTTRDELTALSAQVAALPAPPQQGRIGGAGGPSARTDDPATQQILAPTAQLEQQGDSHQIQTAHGVINGLLPDQQQAARAVRCSCSRAQAEQASPGSCVAAHRRGDGPAGWLHGRDRAAAHYRTRLGAVGKGGASSLLPSVVPTPTPASPAVVAAAPTAPAAAPTTLAPANAGIAPPAVALAPAQPTPPGGATAVHVGTTPVPAGVTPAPPAHSTQATLTNPPVQADVVAFASLSLPESDEGDVGNNATTHPTVPSSPSSSSSSSSSSSTSSPTAAGA